jgi:hypothetical protein
VPKNLDLSKSSDWAGLVCDVGWDEKFTGLTPGTGEGNQVFACESFREGRLPDWIDHRPVFWSTFSVIARSGHPRPERAGITPGNVVPIDLFCDLGHASTSLAARACRRSPFAPKQRAGSIAHLRALQ